MRVDFIRDDDKDSIRGFLLALALAASAFAQGNLGGITGTVADTSNAAVPEVKLTLTSTSTNTSVSVTADSSGVYSFRGIQPGRPPGGGEARVP